MENGDMVLVSYTGKDMATGKIFETTDVEKAKESGFWRENAVFAPVPVIIGNNDLLKALEEELLKMKEGESKTVRLGPDKAFGQRRKELSGVIPMQEFRKRQINPARGMIIDVNGRYGRVQSISGGRIRVDFNSDLAGKGKKAKTKITGNELEVTLPSGLPPEIQQVKQLFNAMITKNIKGIEKVRFVEEFEKPKEEKVSKEAVKKTPKAIGAEKENKSKAVSKNKK